MQSRRYLREAGVFEKMSSSLQVYHMDMAFKYKTDESKRRSRYGLLNDGADKLATIDGKFDFT